MNVYFITFRSVTLAQRGEGALAGEGVHCTLTRTPRWMEERGCGYCLRLRGNDPARWVGVLRQRAVEFLKVYLRRADGTVEEVAV